MSIAKANLLTERPAGAYIRRSTCRDITPLMCGGYKGVLLRSGEYAVVRDKGNGLMEMIGTMKFLTGRNRKPSGNDELVRRALHFDGNPAAAKEELEKRLERMDTEERREEMNDNLLEPDF